MQAGVFESVTRPVSEEMRHFRTNSTFLTRLFPFTLVECCSLTNELTFRTNLMYFIKHEFERHGDNKCHCREDVLADTAKQKLIRVVCIVLLRAISEEFMFEEGAVLVTAEGGLRSR